MSNGLLVVKPALQAIILQLSARRGSKILFSKLNAIRFKKLVKQARKWSGKIDSDAQSLAMLRLHFAATKLIDDDEFEVAVGEENADDFAHFCAHYSTHYNNVFIKNISQEADDNVDGDVTDIADATIPVFVFQKLQEEFSQLSIDHGGLKGEYSRRIEQWSQLFAELPTKQAWEQFSLTHDELIEKFEETKALLEGAKDRINVLDLDIASNNEDYTALISHKTTLEGYVGDRDRIIEQNQLEIDASATSIASLEATIAELKIKVDDLEETIDNKDTTIQELLTAPDEASEDSSDDAGNTEEESAGTPS